MFSLLTRLVLGMMGRPASPRLAAAVVDALAFSALCALAAGLYWRGHSTGVETEKIKCSTAQMEQDRAALQAEVDGLRWRQTMADEALAAAQGREAAAQIKIDELSREVESYVAQLPLGDGGCRLSAADVERLRHITTPAQAGGAK